MNFKPPLKLTFILLFFLMLLPVCQGTFDVYPRELSITMDNKLIQGNTSKNIRIINNNDVDVNISWYVDHPQPISMMRSNKTSIPDLSWIDVKPQWQIVTPHSSVKFYIYLGIPQVKENLDQHWETWITFKTLEKQFINIENAVRLYIDTPAEKTTNNNQDSDSVSISIEDQIELPLFDFVFVAIIIILFIISILIIKNKK